MTPATATVERVDHAIERLGDLPDLLDAELPDLRLAVGAEVELADRGPPSDAPAALCEHREAGLDVGPGLEVAKRLSVLARPLSPERTPRTAPSATSSCDAAVSVRT